MEEAREDEFRKLMEEISSARKIVQDLDIVNTTNHQTKAYLTQVLGSHRASQLVILDLCNLQHDLRSKLHLALALSLTDMPHLHISEIFVYASMLNEVEPKALKALHCKPLPYTYLMTSEFDNPTILFMPSSKFDILGELLKKNWCPSQLKKMVVLGVSLNDAARSSLRRIGKMLTGREMDKYIDSTMDDNSHPLPWIGEKVVVELIDMLKEGHPRRREALRIPCKHIYHQVDMVPIPSKYVYEHATMIPDDDGFAIRMHYVCAILDHVVEFKLIDFSGNDESLLDKAGSKSFQGFSWQFFDLNKIEAKKMKKKKKNSLLGLPIPISAPYHASTAEEHSWFRMVDENQTKKCELLLLREMIFVIDDLKASEFYLSLRRRLQADTKLGSEITARLASEERVQMVIYGLGSLVDNFHSRFQLALALLLRQDTKILKIGEIQIYDPMITRLDTRLMSMFGCTVLTVNERCRRRIEKPTVFFTPFLMHELMDNILKANWCLSRLSKIVWLAYSLKDICKKDGEIDPSDREDIKHMHAIESYVAEFVVSDVSLWTPFDVFKWQVFEIDPEVDFNALLPVGNK